MTKNYRIAIALILLFQTFNLQAEPDAAEPPECASLYKGWVLNTIIAGACELDPTPAHKLGMLVKDICHQELSENDRLSFSTEVFDKWKSDAKRMGKDRLCNEARPTYETMNDTLFSEN